MAVKYTSKINHVILSLLLGLALFSCNITVENKAVDAFGWEVLTADSSPDSARIMGLTDQTRFLASIAKFPWADQTRLADSLRKVSPTLSVTDLQTDRTLFISSISTGQTGQLSYYIGYIYPVEKTGWSGTQTYRQVDTYEVNEIDKVRQIVSLFFNRTNQTLQKLKNYQLVLPGTPELGSWEKYVKYKGNYLKAAKE